MNLIANIPAPYRIPVYNKIAKEFDNNFKKPIDNWSAKLILEHMNVPITRAFVETKVFSQYGNIWLINFCINCWSVLLIS